MPPKNCGITSAEPLPMKKWGQSRIRSPLIILPTGNYDWLIEAAGEDAADAKAARRALDRIRKREHSLSSPEVDTLLAAKTPLAF
jgi:hypothetical protein